MKRLFLLEDDLSLISGLSFAVKKQGYEIDAARTILEADTLWANGSYDLAILDVSLPDGSGFDFCRKIRRMSKVPVMFLTAADEETDIIMGLDMGGDDYITKLYDIEELAARIEAHLRRLERRGGEDIHQGGSRLYLNVKSQRAYLDGRDMLLKPKEYRLLAALMRNRGRYMEAGELYREIWDMAPNRDIRTVWVHISNLRKKLQDADGELIADIECKRALGYKLVMFEDESED